jgi:hypothetical protein
MEEARQKLLDTMHYGSWDTETDYGSGGKIRYSK